MLNIEFLSSHAFALLLSVQFVFSTTIHITGFILIGFFIFIQFQPQVF